MLRNLAIGLLLALAFALSLFYRSYNDPLQFPVMVLLAVATLAALPRRELSIPLSPPVIVLVAVTLPILVAFSFSTIPFSSQIALCIFCALPITFLTTSIVITGGAKQSSATSLKNGSPHPARTDVQIFSLPIFFLLSLWAITQTLITGTRAPGPFLDPNMLAAILSIGLLCATGLSLKKKQAPFTLLALLLFAGLVSTGSRSGIAASLIALTTLFLTARIHIQRKHIILITLTALAILAALGAPLLLQIGDIANIAAPSFTDRLALWHSAWRMALAHPFLGTGLGTFHFYYPAYRDPSDQSVGNFAHSDPLQMAAEMGFAAPVLFYLFLALILRRTLHALGRTSDRGQRLAILTPFTALLTVALQAHINYLLYLLPVMIACGVLLALWHAATTDIIGSGTRLFTLPKLRQRLWALYLGTVLSLYILGLSFTSAAGLYYLQKSQAATDPQTSLIALGRAEQLTPLSFIDPEIEMASTNLHLIDRTDSIKSAKLKEDLLAGTVRLLDNAAYWNPAWAEIDNLKGEMYQIRNQKGPMLESWFTAIKKNPMHFAARKSLALALKAEGRNQDAEDVATDGLKYPHPLAYRDWAISFIKATHSK